MERKTIIDHMLSVIGESSVSERTSDHPSAMTANRILTTEDLAFQGRGWWFNTELNLKIVQDTDGKVAIPENALECAISNVANLSSAEKARYVRRGSFMYDVYNHTEVLNTSLSVDVVLQLDIEDLPTVAATYLMRKAAEEMYLDDDGDPSKLGKLEQRRAEAWQALKARELTVLAVSSKDNQTAQSLFSRLSPGFSGSNANLIGGRYR